jgi:hypothetical protein
MPRRLLGALPLCLVPLALSAAPAVAAPSWSSPPSDLVAPIVDKHAYGPQIAVDADGDAVAVWQESTPTDEQFIEADVRPASTGKWGTPVAISTAEYPNDPHVAIDAEGEAVAVWTATKDAGVNYLVQAATGSATTGKWQTAVTVSPESQYAEEPQVAVNAGGQAVAAWRGNHPEEMIEAAVKSAQGPWQTPVDVSGAAGYTRFPQVAIDAHGDAVAVWAAYNGKYEYPEGSTLSAGGAWRTPVTLSAPGDDASPPQAGVDASGDALAVFCDHTTETIQSAQVSADGGAWNAPVTVAPDLAGSPPDVVVNQRGNAIVTWGQNRSTENTAWAALGSAVTNEWQAPTDAIPSSEKRTTPVQAALDPQGDALATWIDEEGGGVVEAATIPVGSTVFSAPVSLSPTDVNEPQVAFGGAGVGVAVWEEGEEDSNTPDATIVQAAAYTGTVIVAVPPSVRTGPAAAVTQTSATVTGTVDPNGIGVSSCELEYGTTPSYGSEAPCSQTVGSGEARVAVSAPLAGLSPGTTYHYRVLAANAAGPGYGADATFTTESPPPPAEVPPATTSTTSSSTVTTGFVSSPKAVEQLLQGCGSNAVVLNDVYVQGDRVAISGSAAKSLVGKKVKILFNEGKQVATATVGANGQYATSAPLPPAKIRDSLSTRYTAEIGKLRSLNLKLLRRLLLEPPKASGTTVTLAGRVTLPLTRPVAPVVVEQQLECGKTTVVKSFQPSSSGRFDVSVSVPPGARAAIFRLTTKVAANTRSTKHGFTTYSLPLPVALG